MTTNPTTNLEVFETKIDSINKEKSNERIDEFSKKYDENLSKLLGNDNSEYIIIVRDLYERTGDINSALNKAFKNILSPEEIKYLESELSKKTDKDKKIEKKEEVPSNIKESIYYPILHRFIESGYIKLDNGEKEENKINEILGNGDDESKKTRIENLINSSEFQIDAKQKKEILQALSKSLNIGKEKEKKNKDTLDDIGSFEQSQLYKDFKDFMNTSRNNIDAFEIDLSYRYIIIPNKDGTDRNKESKIKDLNTALDTEKNKILKDHKNNKSFREVNSGLINEIERSTNIEEKYILVNKLFIIGNTEFGKYAINNKTQKNVASLDKKISKQGTIIEQIQMKLRENKEENYSKMDKMAILSLSLQLLGTLDNLIGEENNSKKELLALKSKLEDTLNDPKKYNRQSIEKITNEINSFKSSTNS
nr:hypothetical protein [Candidatus Gracilibacteria bacterium]